MSGQRTVYVLLCVRKLEKKNRHNSGVILRQKKANASQRRWRVYPAAHPPPPSNRAGPGDPAPSTDPSEPPQQTLPAGVLPPPLTPHLHVHVPVDGDEVTLVLHPPLQLHHHRFPRQPVEEGFGVEGQALPGENKRVRPFPPLTAASGPLTAPHNAPSPPPALTMATGRRRPARETPRARSGKTGGPTARPLPLPGRAPLPPLTPRRTRDRLKRGCPIG